MSPERFRPATSRCLALALVVLVSVGLAAACRAAGAEAARAVSGVFVLVTVDKTTWEPYEYGSAFFYNSAGDAYTASHVVADAVKNPDLRLVAIVDGAEYIARALCWNPASPDRTDSFNRDVAVVHVGPEVPLFPIGHYRPASGRLAP